ncbi:MAG: YtxH domain-containing protein [Ignavibacteria bacterium]|nr:YtxH domain-containing protein [Ignavibacteria bacterium]
MNQNDGSTAKGFLLGAIVGGAVGAAVALLFAPKSGKDLRADISDRGEDFYDKAQTYFKTPVVEGDDFINEGRLKAQRIVHSAREQADSLMSNAEQVLRDARSRAQSIKETVQSGAAKVSDAARAGADAFKSEMKQ